MILLALLLPMIPGYFLARILFPNIPQKVLLLGALLIGHGLFSSFIYLLYSSGLRITTSLSLSVFFAFCAISYFLYKHFTQSAMIHEGNEEKTTKEPNKTERALFIFLSSVSFLFFVMVVVISLTDSISDWPGIGVWGLKAKIIYFSQNCLELLVNKEIDFSHSEYPLGYPLMLVWCWHIAGGYDKLSHKNCTIVLGSHFIFNHL